jgi:hypothetical protein
MVPMLHRGVDDGCHFLLIRRSLTDPQEKSYYFVFAPTGSTRIARSLRPLDVDGTLRKTKINAKDLGLDHYEVRCNARLVSPPNAGDGGNGLSCRNHS